MLKRMSTAPRPSIPTAAPRSMLQPTGASADSTMRCRPRFRLFSASHEIEQLPQLPQQAPSALGTAEKHSAAVMMSCSQPLAPALCAV